MEQFGIHQKLSWGAKLVKLGVGRGIIMVYSCFFHDGMALAANPLISFRVLYIIQYID